MRGQGIKCWANWTAQFLSDLQRDKKAFKESLLYVIMYCFLFTGYGFVDFETSQAAEVAVQALQAQGIQAQMAKVGHSLFFSMFPCDF